MRAFEGSKGKEESQSNKNSQPNEDLLLELEESLCNAAKDKNCKEEAFELLFNKLRDVSEISEIKETKKRIKTRVIRTAAENGQKNIIEFLWKKLPKDERNLLFRNEFFCGGQDSPYAFADALAKSQWDELLEDVFNKLEADREKANKGDAMLNKIVLKWNSTNKQNTDDMQKLLNLAKYVLALFKIDEYIISEHIVELKKIA